MTIAPLLGQLRNTARTERERRLDAARDEAERLEAGAAATLERRRQLERERRTAEWSRERERRLDDARAAAARDTLAASDRLVRRVLACVRERAAEFDRAPEAAQWRAATIASAIEYLPDGPVVLRTAHAGSAAAVRACAPGREVREVAGQDVTGVVLETAGGDVRVEATLERFLHSERARLTQMIVARSSEGWP